MIVCASYVGQSPLAYLLWVLIDVPWCPQEPNLSKMPSATTAACLLRSLFKKGRLGSLIRHSLSAEICELTQSANPISILSSKLDKLSPETKDLLKQLLRLFAKVMFLQAL